MNTPAFLAHLQALHLLPSEDVALAREYADRLTDAARAELAAELEVIHRELEEVEHAEEDLLSEIEAFVQEWEHRARHDTLSEAESASRLTEAQTLERLLPEPPRP